MCCKLKNDVEDVKVSNNSAYFIKKFEESNYSQSVIEAVINAIQAHATNINVGTYSALYDEQGLGYENKLATDGQNICGFKIEDNGDGFIDENCKAITEWNCDHKENIGCEGVGRANYLKTFNSTKIISFVDGKKKSLNFTATSEYKDIITTDIKPEDVEKYELEKDEGEKYKNKTILELNGIKKNIKNRDLTYKKDQLFKIIYDKVKLFLFLNNDTDITINIDGKTIKTDDVKFEKPINFTIQKEQETKAFTLWYSIRPSTKTSFETHICYNKFSVGKMTIKPLSLDEDKFKVEKHEIILVLEGDDIKEGKNVKYKNFIAERITNNHELRTEENGDLFNGYVSWKDVREEIEKQLEKLYNAKFPNRLEDIQREINENKNKYIWLNDYFDEKTIKPKQAVKKYIDEQIDILEKQETDITEDDINKMVNTNLVAYIQWREKQLKKLETDFNNPKTKESAIHNWFVPMNKEVEHDDLLNNKMWALDDKFMLFDKCYSDKQLNQISKDVYEMYKTKFNEELKIDNEEDANIRRPDIALLKMQDGQERLVLLEFKRPNADWFDYVKGLKQLRYYAEYFARKHNILYPFAFLIVNDLEKNNALLDDLDSDKYVIIYNSDNFQIYQNVLDLHSEERSKIDNKAIRKGQVNIQVISSQAMISDAKTRNQTFINIIKKSKGLL